MSDRLKEVYAPNDIKKKEGDTIHRPKLANLLERIAENREEGVKLFYSGAVADEIINAVRILRILLLKWQWLRRNCTPNWNQSCFVHSKIINTFSEMKSILKQIVWDT